MIKAGALDSGCIVITWKAHKTLVLVYNPMYFHLIGVGPGSAFFHLMKIFKH